MAPGLFLAGILCLAVALPTGDVLEGIIFVALLIEYCTLTYYVMSTMSCVSTK